MKNLLLNVCIFTACCGLHAQDFLAKNEYFFSLPNRLNLFVAEDSLVTDITVGITFNCGSFLEDRDFDGLSFLYEKTLVAQLRRQLKGSVKEYVFDSSQFSIYSETSFEHVFLSVTFPEKQLSDVLKALYQSLTTPADARQITNAVYLSNAARQELSTNPLARLDSLTGSVLWETNYSKRVFINAWNDSAAALLPERLTVMAQQYFCPGNALLLVKGNVKGKAMEETVKKIFEGWVKCSISLLGRFPGYNYRALLVNSQLIIEDSSVSAPFYEVAFQGPTTFEDRKNNYCALIFSELLANPGSKINRFLKDSCMLASVNMQNDKARFLSQLAFTALPEADCVGESYACFRSFLSGTNDSLLDSVELALGKEAVISKFNQIKSDGGRHVFLVAKYWISLSIEEYNTFTDSVKALTVEEMRLFLDACLRKRYSVAGLCISAAQRKASGIDSIFTPTATGILAYRVNFLKNSAKFASAADDSVYNSLVQFLKLNPEIKIKVNGMCHQSELLDVADEAMLTWVRAQEHFMMNPPSLLEKKKYRLDVYRALSLIRKLTESGIAVDRLFGTGNLVRAPEEPEKSQSANFSLMFN